ncbi:MAG: GNAT family N-acetyltransferase [Marinifilaceae bacterium]
MDTDVNNITDFFVSIFGDDVQYAEKAIARVPHRFRFVDKVNAQVVAMAHLLPYKHDLWGKEIAVGYFFGFACAQEYRGGERAKHLFVKMMREAYDEGMWVLEGQAASFKLNKYYLNMFQLKSCDCGVWERFDVSDEVCAEDARIEQVDFVETEILTKLLSTEQHCLIPDDDSIKASAIYVDYYTLVDAENNAVGIVGVDRSELPYIYLLVAHNAQADRLLNFVCRKYGVEYVFYKRNNIFSQTESNGLCRIINVKEMLGLYAASRPDVCKTYCVHDPYIDENNGVFRVCDGMCTVCIDEVENCEVISIDELTALLMKPFYMPVSYY